ncbi:growth-regulated alpha protein-like [Betta splendens]|uniref:Growth-regulated alpha protein-like n=1 Tax=Betta splendens TaxID=158456 RepID=A0A6P7KQL5_BETSP|nr:growth-regulated alpha protein-like [Betta splendens]
MKLHHRSVFPLAALGFFWVLVTVRESGSTFVPGRCLCPQTQPGVRGQLADLKVLPRSPSCHIVTVIVTLKNSSQVCLSPESPMGKQLIRCWNRAHRLNRDIKPCLRRKRRGGRRRAARQRTQRHNRRASS